ncbi:MAG: metallophosphoesterase family protein [Devosia sp.]|nr:metallophosphoesterase family protein [Devosia sp.]
MRIAVISDVHGNLIALEAVLADIRTQGADAILALGDYLSGPFDPTGTAGLFLELAIPSVRGNHDRWVAEGREQDWPVDALVRRMIEPKHRDWLAALPLNHVFEDEVFMCHGTPTADDVLWLDGVKPRGGVFQVTRAVIEREAEGFDYSVLLCGHSHLARTLRLSDGRLVVNPGSVGLPLALGSPDARYALIEKHAGNWAVSFRALPYDHQAAAAQANALGYERWATAVSTGWSTARDL